MQPLQRSMISLVPPALVAALAVVGCAVHDRASRDVAEALGDWQRKHIVAAPGEASADRTTTQPTTVRTAKPPAVLGDDRLQSYIAQALDQNPSLKASAAEMRARLARIRQATSLPDPVLRAVARPEPIQTAAGDVVFTLGVAQTIPLPEKLERAGQAAAAEVRMAIEQLNAERLQLVADVERAFYALYLMDRYVDVTTESRRLLEDLERVVTTQYEVGSVRQQDLLRVQTEAARLRDDEQRYRLRRRSAAAALNRLLGQAVETSHPSTSPRSAESVLLDVDALLALAQEHNPDLKRLVEQLRRDEHRVRLAELEYWPDLTLGFEWNRLVGRTAFRPPPNPQTGVTPPFNRASERGDDNWAISFQLNLPIWVRRIEAAQRQARQELRRSQYALHAFEDRVAYRIFEAWTDIEAQQRTVALLETTLIPQARQTYEVTLTAYQAGTSDFLSVIDAWRRWLDFELMLHREVVDRENALAQLQREVGLQVVQHPAPPTRDREDDQ